MQTDKPIILFDGVCNLCNRGVQFIIKKDKKKKFLFASLGESSLISSNSELPLLRYKAITKDELKSLISILNDIDIKIEYESMYGDKKTI